MPLVVRSENRLVVRLTGKPGSVLVLYVLAGAADIGPAGGRVVAPVSGAEIEVPIGAFRERVLVQLRDTAGVQPQYTPLGLTGHVLHVTLGSLTAVDSTNPSTLYLRLPLAVAVSTRTPVHVRAVLDGLDSSSWWGSGVAVDAQAEFAIPVAGLSELPSVFETLELQVVLNLETVSTLGVADGSPSVNTSARSSCATYPAPGAGWPATAPLRVDPNSAELHEGSVAVVAVHGWDWDVLGCDGFADTAKTESGEVYFAKLLAVLEDQFGETTPIVVFNYPTFNDFEASGQELAARLNELTALDGVVLVGHSMGGLVAREAAHEFANTYNRPAFVHGIVTLATPHGGAALATILRWLTPRQTDGTRSLERGVTRQTEEAPIHAHAGNLVEFDLLGLKFRCKGYFKVLYRRTCELLKGPINLHNDGLVTISSALPSFIAEGVRHSYQGYDHSEMSAGNNLAGDSSDPLFAAVVADIRGLLPGQPVWTETFDSYTAGSWPSPWISDANAADGAQNYVDNAASYRGGQSLRLFGAPNGCWSAIAYRPVTVEPPFELEVTIRNGNEVQTGCHLYRGLLQLRKCCTWTNPARQLLIFRRDGTVEAPDGEALVTFAPLVWYTVRIKYERKSSTQVSLSYWVDGHFLGRKMFAIQAEEDLLDHVNLEAGEGAVWFDEVRILR